MITGAHAIVYSADADADRAFLRELLGTRTVDAGRGWLIMALPPAEVAVHPTDGPPAHELYLMCDDVDATVAELRGKGVELARPVTDEGFGRVGYLDVPGIGELGLYEPRHPVPR